MSTTPASDQSQLAHNEPQLMIPESAMREIAQELGTATINRILLADTVRRLQDAAPAIAKEASRVKKD